MKKQTKLLIITVFIAVAVAGIFQYYFQKPNSLPFSELTGRDFFRTESAATPVPVVKVNTETINIDFGNGKRLSGEVSTQSAYQALEQVAKSNNLQVVAKQYKYGVMVEKIGDIGSTQNSAWMYSVNGKPGQIAADRYVIYPGDTVEWKFSKF